MAAQRPRPTGTAPEPYDGKYEGAIAFWNTLENYYTMNDASYPSQGAKIASALTHFKLGTPAGEWASDQIATALDRTPANYGTGPHSKLPLTSSLSHRKAKQRPLPRCT